MVTDKGNVLTAAEGMVMQEHMPISRAHSFPRQILPNSAAHRGKFLKFRGWLRPPILEYTVPTLAQLCPQNFSIIVKSNY